VQKERKTDMRSVKLAALVLGAAFACGDSLAELPTSIFN
jgi:hypothetical protein